MSTSLSIDKNLTLPELEVELRFLEEGRFLVKGLAATKNTTDNTEFNTVDVDDRDIVLANPLELFTTPTAQGLDTVAQQKQAQGFDVLFLSDEVFVSSQRVPVGAVRKAEVTGNLSWEANHPERATWSKQLIDSVKQYKPRLDAGNPEGFIAGYDRLTPVTQVKFWAELIIAVAKFESGWDPHNIFHEPPPLGVDSIGLLQLSYEDETPCHLDHLNKAGKDLENPLINLRCGLKIFSDLLARDGTVTRLVNQKHRGAAAYWSVIREGSGHHLAEIKELTKKNTPV